jgi:hypothetical protein
MTDTDRRRQVKHDVGVSYEALNECFIQDAALDKRNVRLRPVKVLQRTSREVIDDRHVVTQMHKPVDEM